MAIRIPTPRAAAPAASGCVFSKALLARAASCELAADVPDVHRMVGNAFEQHGSLTELPWTGIVAALAAWQPRRRRRPPA